MGTQPSHFTYCRAQMDWVDERICGGVGDSIQAAYMCVRLGFSFVLCVSRKGGMQHPKDTVH